MSQENEPRIGDETVRHVAALANLELAEDEVGRYGGTLQKILAYVAELDALPADLPEAAGAAEVTPERPDAVVAPLAAELAMASAPASSGTAFLVPRIIE